MHAASQLGIVQHMFHTVCSAGHAPYNYIHTDASFTLTENNAFQCFSHCLAWADCQAVTIVTTEPGASDLTCKLYDLAVPVCQPFSQNTAKSYTKPRLSPIYCPLDYTPGPMYTSCYKLVHTTRFLTHAQVLDECFAVGANVHAVAIESPEEQQYLAGLAAAENCYVVWTGGFAGSPYSQVDWKWALAPGVSKPVAYTTFNNGEPNNVAGLQEDAIGMMAPSFKWNDVLLDLSTDGWYADKSICFICEAE